MVRVALAILFTATVALADPTGYTVFVREQVQPEYLSPGVHNPGLVPDYPKTFGARVCFCEGFSIYNPDPNKRKSVWFDSAGTATYQEVMDICQISGTSQK